MARPDLQAQKAQLDTQQAKIIDHVVKTTRSFAPGLFHCYHVPDLPATNNGLGTVLRGRMLS